MKRYGLHYSFVLLLITLLSGCGSAGCPTLPGGMRYCLQPPASGPALAVSQKLIITAEQRRETVLVRVENNHERLTLVGVTPLGQTLLTLTWDGTDITVRGPPGGQPSVQPGTLLALLQLALWPHTAVQAGLAHDVVWAEDSTGVEVIYNGTSALSIRRTGTAAPYDRLHIDMPDAGVRLDIETLAATGDVR